MESCWKMNWKLNWKIFDGQLQYHLASLAEKTSQGCRTHAKERTPTIEKVRNHPRLVYLLSFKQEATEFNVFTFQKCSDPVEIQKCSYFSTSRFFCCLNWIGGCKELLGNVWDVGKWRMIDVWRYSMYWQHVLSDSMVQIYIALRIRKHPLLLALSKTGSHWDLIERSSLPGKNYNESRWITWLITWFHKCFTNVRKLQSTWLKTAWSEAAGL